MRDSFQMQVMLKTHARVYDYVVQCSREYLSKAGDKESKTARALADRYGMPFPLFLHEAARSGHPWASDVDRIERFALATRLRESASLSSEAMLLRAAATPLPPDYDDTDEDGDVIMLPTLIAGNGNDSKGSDSKGSGSKGSDSKGSGSPSGSPSPPANRRKGLSFAARMSVWNKWQEGGAFAGSGKCHACERVIVQQEFECGHILAVAKGGTNSIDNLRPLCRACNRSMGTMSLDEFRATLFDDVVPQQPPTP